MSDAQEAADILADIEISRILILVPSTIILYDHILTFDREVSQFWGGPLTWVSFFYLNRYLSLLGSIPMVVQYTTTTRDPARYSVCRGLRSYHQCFALVTQVLVGIIFVIRTYALYERSKKILAFMMLVVCGVTVSSVRLILTRTDLDALSPIAASFACPFGEPHAERVRLAESWAGLLVFDVMIFALTLYKILSVHRDNMIQRGGMVYTFLHDGVVYFGVMVVCTSFNIATYTMGSAFIAGTPTMFTNILSSVMISRLLFNLYNRHRHTPADPTDDTYDFRTSIHGTDTTVYALDTLGSELGRESK